MLTKKKRVMVLSTITTDVARTMSYFWRERNLDVDETEFMADVFQTVLDYMNGNIDDTKYKNDMSMLLDSGVSIRQVGRSVEEMGNE